MIDDYPTLVFRVGEYEVIEGLDLVVQVNLIKIKKFKLGLSRFLWSLVCLSVSDFV